MGITESLGKAVLELSTDSAKFFTDVDKAKKEARSLGTEFQGMSQSTTGLTSSLATLGSALGITFSVGAIVGFGKELLSTGDNIQKMADRLDDSTTAVQRLDHIADQTSVSFDNMVGAIQGVQQRLGDGDQGLVGAMEQLGINTEDFLKQSPYEQFLQLAEGLSKVEDPTKRAALAGEIFTKKWKDLAPTFIANIREMGDAASVWSPQTVKSFDAAGHAIGRFWKFVKANAANQIGLAILSVEALPKEVNRVFQAMHLDVGGAIRDVKDLGQWWDVLVGKIEKPPKVAIAQAVKNMFSGQGVPHIRLSANDVQGIENELNTERKALDEASKAASDHVRVIKDLADAYSGTKVMKAASDALEAVNRNLHNGIPLTKMTRDQQDALNRVLGDAIDAYRAMGRTVPPELSKVFDATFHLKDETLKLLDPIERFRDDARLMVIPLQSLSQHLRDMPWPTPEHIRVFQEIPKPVKDATDHIAEMARSLSQLAQVSNGAFGSVVSGLSTLVSVADVAQKALGSLATQTGKIALDFSKTAILNTVSGLLALAAAGVQAGKALQPLLGLHHGKLGALLGTNSDGRQLVKTFADLHGGFENLHNDLLKLGPDGERLWIAFTQGVGRANPKQAQAAIDGITKALDAADKKQAQFNTDLGRFLGEVDKLGVGLPDSLAEYLSELERGGKLTQDNLDLLHELLGRGQADWKAIEAAVQRYSGDISKLGGSFQEARLHDSWQQVIDDMDLFARGGISAGDALNLTKGKIIELVQQSIAFGTEIPENMRPWIQALIDAGELVDGTGTKITSLDKLKFGETLQTTIEALTLKIQALIDTLNHVPTKVDTQLTVHQRTVKDPEADDTGDTAVPRPMASGGFGRVTTPTLFLAGEAGPEDFAFSGGNRRFSDGGSTQPIVINLTNEIQAWDGVDVRRVMESRDVAEGIKRQLLSNLFDVGTAVRQVATA
jgi:methyl-accepting chemotaxis protein